MDVGSNWAGHHRYRATQLHRPTSIPELQQIVSGAPRIRALGSRHSFNALADSTELVSLDALDPAIEIDPDAETVSFSAGVRYGELGIALQAQGWALRNLASLPHISVAGAIATATHGSGNGNGTLSRAVAGLDIVTATGEMLTLAPANEEFDGAVVALGALGIVSRVTLDIEPTYAVRQDVFEGLSFTNLLENYDAIVGRAYSVSVFTDWAGESVGTVWLKSVIGSAKPPQSLYGATPLDRDIHPLRGLSAETATDQCGVAGDWIDRLPHFKLEFTPSNGDELQSEYLVPREHAVAAISAIRELGALITPLLHVSELRTVAADSLWLSGAYETDVTAIHFTWKNDPVAVLAILPVIERALAAFDARPHWGKLFHEVRRELYPRLDDFVALATELDPHGKFRNEFLERHVF